jgi:hypothetical protein
MVRIFRQGFWKPLPDGDALSMQANGVSFFAESAMKTCRTIILTVLVIGFITGCASHRYTVVEPPEKPLTSYSILEIAEFKTNLNDAESKELADRFAGRLYRAIMEYREENPTNRAFQEITLDTGQTKGVLLMEGTVISYEEGSRAKRYWIGFGSGKAYCTIQVVFVDKETGEEVSRTNFDGELAMGLFGGDADEAVDGVVNSFIDYMRQYMSS